MGLASFYVHVPLAAASFGFVSTSFTVKGLKATLSHFHLNKIETSAATRPKFELNFSSC